MGSRADGFLSGEARDFTSQGSFASLSQTTTTLFVLDM